MKLSDLPAKSNLVKILIDDFINMFPDSKRPERLNLYMKLNMMEVQDLEILVGEVERHQKERGIK